MNFKINDWVCGNALLYRDCPGYPRFYGQITDIVWHGGHVIDDGRMLTAKYLDKCANQEYVSDYISSLLKIEVKEES
ncbi:MAG: hypothetical protein CMI54_02505 [Parcubacteria group bacterium]|jgi:hypothetical protein|nr:hypothetical protein [Parcubacteria group bacterium]|tara:strand:+ start:7542 stop:7772 length:231 start_codon:yes stop_codon:yes gene_type:complete